MHLLPFSEPAERTICGHYEFLLMEAARLTDEGSNPLQNGPSQPPPLETLAESEAAELANADCAATGQVSVRIEELVLASGSGTLLSEWQCADVITQVD